MSIVHYLSVYDFVHKMRLGNKCDGGYVIGLLDEDGEQAYDCYISAGISNEESFSRDFIKHFNMNKQNSFGFDGTITNYPYHYTSDITFIKKNINAYFDKHHANLQYFISNYKNIFLKMDIEGWEFQWLSSLTIENLLSFKQIVMELHGINDNTWGASYQLKRECLHKLSTTHYLIHIHGNNHSGVNNNIPDVVEVTFIRKDCFSVPPKLNQNPLPIHGLDFPCNLLKPDYNLSFPPFVN